MPQFNIQPNMVFPSTKMDSVNKLISEGSLTRLINKLIDTDSYILPPNSVELEQYVNTDYGTMIEVTDLANDSMEFVIHGYYFNMGMIRNLVQKAMNLAESDLNQTTITGNIMLSAGIDIDNDKDNGYKFPELFGENLNQQTDKTLVSNDAIADPSKLPNISDYPVLNDKPITKIVFSMINEDGQEEYFGEGSYDSLGAIQPPNDKQLITGNTYYFTIYYSDYSSLITFYVTNPDDDIQTVRDNTSSNNTLNYIYPDNYDSYYLKLLYIDRSNIDSIKVYIPLTNFSKLKHQSIASIDGGII